MSVYEKNMREFGIERKDLFEELKKQKMMQAGATERIQIKNEKAKDGSPVMVIVKATKKFRLNSIYHPVKEAERWCRQYDLKKPGMNIVMFGIGNLLFVKELVKRAEKDSRIYLYEPCMDIFIYLLNEVDMTSLISDRRIYFYIEGINEKKMYYDMGKKTHWSNLQSQLSCCHPQYDELFLEEYQKWNMKIQQLNVSVVANKNTLMEFAEKFANNAIRNLPFIVEASSVFDLVGKFPEEIPAIVVAAGPSLDKNIQILKQAENRAFIIATDTAVKHLLREGIYFDSMVAMDPGKSAECMLYPECRDIPLFCSLSANPEILKYHTGKKIWFRESGEFLKTLYHKHDREFQELHAGSHVGAGAWTICRVLGFKKIILVGQDLAYGKQGGTHAGNEKAWESERNTAEIYVQGMHGERLRSRRDWKIYLEWYEREFEEYAAEVETIDATEGGALISGTKLMTLQDAINRCCKGEVDIGRIFRELQGSFARNREEVKNTLLYLEKEHMSISSKTEEILRLLGKSIIRIEKGSKDSEVFDYSGSKLKKVNSYISEQLFYRLIEQYADGRTVEIVEELNEFQENSVENPTALLQLFEKYYNVLRDILKEVKNNLLDSIENIKKIK